jgi:hypothetical protein
LDDQVALGFCRREQIDALLCHSNVRVARWQSGNLFRQLARRPPLGLRAMARFPSFAWQRSDNDVDAGAIGLSINCFLAYQVQRSFKSLRPVIPIVPRPVRQAQSAVEEFLHDATDLDPITYLIPVQEIILDHFTQMLLREENGHRTSL